MEESTKKDLKEVLTIMKEIYGLSVNRMKRGARLHGTAIIKKPFEELEEELADAFNYMVIGYVKVLKACGNYKDRWNIDLPIQEWDPRDFEKLSRKSLGRGLDNETETPKAKKGV